MLLNIKYWLYLLFNLTMAYGINRNIALLVWRINQAEFFWTNSAINTKYCKNLLIISVAKLLRHQSWFNVIIWASSYLRQ